MLSVFFIVIISFSHKSKFDPIFHHFIFFLDLLSPLYTYCTPNGAAEMVCHVLRRGTAADEVCLRGPELRIVLYSFDSLVNSI